MPFRIPRPVASRLSKTVGLVSLGLVPRITRKTTPKRVKLYKRIDQSPLFYLEKIKKTLEMFLELI